MCRLLLLGIAWALISSVADAAGYAPFDGAKNAASVTVAMADKEVVIEGTITSVAAPQGPGQPTMLTISPAAQKPPVVVAYMPDFATTLHGDIGIPKAGAHVSAMGKLWNWNGMLLVRVLELNQIRIDSHAHTFMRGIQAPVAPTTSAPFVAATPAAVPVVAAPAPGPAGIPVADAAGYYHEDQIAQLSSLIGSDLSFSGKVTAYRASWGPTAPHILTFGAGAEKLEVVYWTTETSPAPPGVTVIGATVYARGLLQDYRGKMQLRISDLSRLSTQPLDQGATSAPAPVAGR